MAKGTVKWFDEGEGFGFIQRDDGPDVYVDGAALVGAGMSTLTEGQSVSFDVTSGPRGPHARNVRPL
ncbi:MAG TPA: cold-shock protein [Vicinamibacteria bacterium]|nr:cold-shock protein [Vicinamibacteria bacterium]